jgi:hypothetical protein
VSKVIIGASPLHKSGGLSLTEIEVLGQPPPPSAIAHLIFGLDQHLTGKAIVFLAGCVALLQLALDHWNEHFQGAGDFAAFGLHSHGLIHDSPFSFRPVMVRRSIVMIVPGL